MPWDNTQLEWGNTNTYDIRHKWVGILSYELPWGEDLQGVVARVPRGWQTNVVGLRQTGMAYHDHQLRPADQQRRRRSAQPDRRSRTAERRTDDSALVQHRRVRAAAAVHRGQCTGRAAARTVAAAPRFFDLQDASHGGAQPAAGSNRGLQRHQNGELPAPDGTFGGSTFGSISSTGNSIPRQMQFGIKYLF